MCVYCSAYQHRKKNLRFICALNEAQVTDRIECAGKTPFHKSGHILCLSAACVMYCLSIC